MRKRLIAIACTIALVVGSSVVSTASTSGNVNLVSLSEGEVATDTLPAYAKGSGSVYRDKTIIQELSYKKIDKGECYTYVITREQKVSRADIKALGSDASIGCQFGAFDTYSGDTIGFGVNPVYDVISAEDSGVGVPVYLADVTVDGTVYTLSSYQLNTEPFTKRSDNYYHSTTVEVVNIPKGYDGFAIVTYGLDDEEHEKADEYDIYDKSNGLCANVYTQLSTFISPEHISYYVFE